MRRGELRWYTFRRPDKRRPVLILGRDEVLGQLGEVIVVPVTRTIRELASEVVLTPDDGMPAVCALSFDHISIAQKGRLGAVMAFLPPTRWPEVRTALLTACGLHEAP